MMRTDKLTTGVRGRVVLLVSLVTAVSMALLTAVVAWGVGRTMHASMEDFLRERLDMAQAQVEAGDLAGAVDVTGPVVLQVIDAQGRVLASSAEGLDDLPLLDDVLEDLEDLLDDTDDDDEEDEHEAPESQAQEGGRGQQGSQTDASQTGVAPLDDDLDDDSDVDDDDEQDELLSSQTSGSGPAGERSYDTDDSSQYNDYDYDVDDYGSDYDDSDDDDADYEDDDDDDFDDDAKSFARHMRHVLAMARTAQKRAEETSRVTAEAARLLSEELDVASPYMVDTRNARYKDEPVIVVGLASLASTAEAAASAARLLGIASLVVIAGAALLTWHMVGRTLRPVEQMRASTATIVDDDPSRRLVVPEDDRDLRSLAATFNDLLARSEQALVKQRRFVSDASHQLKSPVAAQKAMIETLRRHPGDVGNGEVLDDLAHENNRLQGIVEDLLALARHDEGRRPAAVPLDLIDVLYEEASALTASTGMPVDTTGVHPVVVRGDAQQLAQAVRNLLDNAARYARAMIAVSCQQEGDVVRIVVADDGPGIPKKDRERVFERFVRLEEGRDVARDSTGLGLAVVQAIAQGHGGRAYFEDSVYGGAAAVIELPTEVSTSSS